MRSRFAFSLIILLATVIGAALFVLLSRTGNRTADRFTIKPGTVETFAGIEGQRVFLNLQQKGDDAWGLLECPDLGIYGFIAGTREPDGNWRGHTVSGTENVDFRFARGLLGLRTHIEIAPAGKPATSIGLKRTRPQFAFRLESYEKKEPGAPDSNNTIEIVQIDSRKNAVRTLLDSRLRRGESSRDNAQALLQEFERSSGRLPPHSGSDTLFQRPFHLYSKNPYASLAAETYIFQGGAHGITVMQFNTIDMLTGRLLEASDYFTGDWQDVLPDRIAEEAARQLLDVAVPGKTANVATLTGYGLFENELPLPSGVFPCMTGFGFHYNRYEIAPGAMGDFLVILPYEKLEDILRDEWKP